MGVIDPLAIVPSHYDVLIIGAGISGIDMAYRIQSELPHYTYSILESRSVVGGTWDLFRYPGIRYAVSNPPRTSLAKLPVKIRLRSSHLWISMASMERAAVHCRRTLHSKVY